MADAPAPSGGGWGAVEIIFGLVLVIGTLATLSGVSLNSSDTSKTAGTTKKSALVSNQYSFNGCTIILSAPKSKATIDTTVTVSGTITGSLDNCTTTSTGTNALYAQVVDSTGSTLSGLMPIAITKSLFGGASFSTTVALSGVARSTSAQVIITGPITNAGKGIVIRIPVVLKSAPAGTVYTTTVPYTADPTTSSNANSNGSTLFGSHSTSIFGNSAFSNTNNSNNGSSNTYAAPTQQYNPPVQQQQDTTSQQNNTDTNTNTNTNTGTDTNTGTTTGGTQNSGAGSNTF